MQKAEVGQYSTSYTTGYSKREKGVADKEERVGTNWPREIWLYEPSGILFSLVDPQCKSQRYVLAIQDLEGSNDG